MATAAVPGRKAYIRSSSASSATTAQTLLAELLDYTLTVEMPEIPVTNHDSSGWDENILGIRKWSWEASCNYLSTGAGQEELRQSLLDADATVWITFQATTAAASKKHVGKTRITRYTQANPTESQILGTFAGVGNGVITRTA